MTEAGLWMLDVFAAQLGEEWSTKAWERDQQFAAHILLAPAVHLIPYAELLDLALRLSILRQTSGAAGVRRQLRTDLKPETWDHVQLQSEVAALAAWYGGRVRVEARTDKDSPPVDVEILLPGVEVMRVEVFGHMTDEGWRDDSEYDDGVTAVLFGVRFEYDIDIFGTLPPRLGDEETAQFIAAVRNAAVESAATKERVNLTFAGADMYVVPFFLSQDGDVLSGPQHVSNPWPRFERRLLRKAKQAIAAGASWLRVDVRDGLWQFTEWAQRDLTSKAEVGNYLHRWLDSSGLDGIVLSSGACEAQGRFGDAEAFSGDGTFVLRRLIGSARVRETIIVPFTPTGQQQGDVWRQGYSAEPEWLAYALSTVGLSPVPELERGLRAV